MIFDSCVVIKLHTNGYIRLQALALGRLDRYTYTYCYEAQNMVRSCWDKEDI